MAQVTLSNGRVIQLLKPVIDKNSLPGMQQTPENVYFDLSGATYNGVIVGIPTSGGTGLTFKSDGTKMYVTDSGAMYNFDLSTAWDLSTATHASTTTLSDIDIGVIGASWSNDGTSLYVAGSNLVRQYDTSTPWDASNLTLRGGMNLGGGAPMDIKLSSDGIEVLVADNGLDIIRRYTLSTPWDLTSYSVNGTFDVSTQSNVPTSANFNGDGTKLFVSEAGGELILQYSLSTPWDISTASYDHLAYNTKLIDANANPRGTVFSPDGTKMFIVDNLVNSVYEVDL